MTAREERIHSTLVNVIKTLVKLQEDTKPQVGAYPPDDDDEFDITDYLCGSEDGAIETGECWGTESRNRTINPIVQDLLKQVRQAKEELY